MALVTCPKCGRNSVSDSGKCPNQNCGCDVASELLKIKKEEERKRKEREAIRETYVCPECNDQSETKTIDNTTYYDEYCKRCGFAIRKHERSRCSDCGSKGNTSNVPIPYYSSPRHAKYGKWEMVSRSWGMVEKRGYLCDKCYERRRREWEANEAREAFERRMVNYVED